MPRPVRPRFSGRPDPVTNDAQWLALVPRLNKLLGRAVKKGFPLWDWEKVGIFQSFAEIEQLNAMVEPVFVD